MMKSVFFVLLSIVSPAMGVSMLRQFMVDQDIDALCTSFEEAYHYRCHKFIPDENTSELSRIIQKEGDLAGYHYIKENLVELDQDLSLNELACLELKQEIRDVEDRYVLDAIIKYLPSTHRFDAALTRSPKVLADRARKARNVKTCNLDLYLSIYGKLNKRALSFLYKMQIPEIGRPNIALTDVIGNYFSKDSLAAAEDLLSKESAARKQFQDAAQKEADELATLTKSCFLDDKEDSCKKANRYMDNKIADRLGLMGIRVLKQYPSLRHGLYSVSKLKHQLDNTEYFTSLEVLGRTLKQVTTVWPLAVAVLVIVAFFYGGELKLLLNALLSLHGFAIIPLVGLASKLLKAAGERAVGFLITASIIACTLLVNLQIIDAEQAATIAYLVVVSYFNLVRPTSGKVIIMSFSPILARYAYAQLDWNSIKAYQQYDFIPSRMSYSNIDVNQMFSYELPSLLACCSVALVLSIYVLCNYCDSIGSAAYRDVVNRMSRSRPVEGPDPQPGMMDYVTSYFSMNTIIFIGCITIPGLLHQSTWILSLAIMFMSMVVSAGIYQFSFHEGYLREGHNTSSTRDRTLETMNVVIGQAPKNIILPKFQNTIIVLLACMAFASGCRLTIPIGIVLAGMMTVLVHTNPGNLSLYLSWISGIVIATCGTLPHAIIGIIYIIMRVGHNLVFDTSSMGIGETMREAMVLT